MQARRRERGGELARERVAVRALDEHAGLEQHLHRLLDEEGHAVAVLHQAIDERGRERLASQAGEQRADLGLGEAPERQLDHVAAAGERELGAWRFGGRAAHARGSVLRAQGPDDEEPRGRGLIDDVPEQLERRGVDPVQVLGHEDQGRPLRQAEEERDDGGARLFPQPREAELGPRMAAVVADREEAGEERRHGVYVHGVVVEEGVDPVLPDLVGVVRAQAEDLAPVPR